jgi:hypothetical protein
VIKTTVPCPATNRTIQPVPATILFRLVINQNKVEDSAMTNIRTITVTYHINEDTGKLVNVTQHDGSPGKNCAPQGAITDCQGLVVSQNSPSSICHLINGVWYCF